MRLKNIIAIPHPDGNRIDLKWENPDPVYTGIRVMRREGTHPTSPDDGVIVTEGIGLTHAEDKNLKEETVYYYALFPYKQNPLEYQIDLHNRASAMATARYNMAGQMMELLPAIYHRYDTVLGQLRHFLDMPGGQLDQLHSFAKAMLNLHNLDKMDGRLLPLLAEWIGWRTDYNLEIEKQRNEITNAPDIYKTIGIIPTAEATVKRLINWESRTKEFVHNVFLSNRPERLNIYLRERSAGIWSEPKEPLSLDFAYEGRPAIVRHTDGTIYLFYHTLKKGQWNIWYKTYQGDKGWAPSQPLTNRAGIDKYPAAAIQGTTIQDTTLWVFWSVFDETVQKWRIDFCTCTDGIWSSIDVFKNPAEIEPLPERKQPCAVTDNTGDLWLFWLERVGARWQLRYNRYYNGGWGSAVTFPVDGTDDPRVEADLFVLFHSSKLWVFWARQEPTAEPGQTRWTIVYRTKGNPNLDDTGWSSIQTFSTTPPAYHDREPAAIVDGNYIELFWSSNRDGSWSIWRNTLDITTSTWGTPEKVAASLYSQRDPLPLLVNSQTLLIYRSNESLSYASKVYGATETVDFRYAGCTTVDTRNARKNSLRGRFEDFQVYTYDTGKNGQRTEEDWYARDTVGVYLTPNTESKELIDRNHKVVESVLKQFLPIQVQPVIIIEPELYNEMIYTYDYLDAEPQHLIQEQMVDTILSEVYRGLTDSYLDRAGFRWLRTWQAEQSYGILPDLSEAPPDLSHRLFLKGVEEGE